MINIDNAYKFVLILFIPLLETLSFIFDSITVKSCSYY